ncbi:hypothetical protein [Dactylosporangium sp. CA-139066]|uniref:hypothetical protein n=1 Tax=Dactylosporangium sp. CA-139066 TaxID=3239930 RepID=UPI003D94C9BD
MSLQEWRDSIDDIARKYLDFQIAAMVLYHTGVQRERAGDAAGAEAFLEVALYARASLARQKGSMFENFSRDETLRAFQRIDYATILWKALPDEAIDDNRPHYDLPPRPRGRAAACDKSAYAARVRALLQEYS